MAFASSSRLLPPLSTGQESSPSEFRDPKVSEFTDHVGEIGYRVWYPLDDYPESDLPPLLSFPVYLVHERLKASDLSTDVAASLLRAMHPDLKSLKLWGFRLDMYILPGAKRKDCIRHYYGEKHARGLYTDNLIQYRFLRKATTLNARANEERPRKGVPTASVHPERSSEERQRKPGATPGLVPRYNIEMPGPFRDLLFRIESENLQGWKERDPPELVDYVRFNYFDEADFMTAITSTFADGKGTEERFNRKLQRNPGLLNEEFYQRLERDSELLDEKSYNNYGERGLLCEGEVWGNYDWACIDKILSIVKALENHQPFPEAEWHGVRPGDIWREAMVFGYPEWYHGDGYSVRRSV